MYYIKEFDPWHSTVCTCPFKYSLQPYTGCEHSCLYCYATAYIPKHNVVREKKDFIKKLKSDVRAIVKQRRIAPVTMANSSDPYPSIERYKKSTRKAIEILIQYNIPVLIVTKSDLITRDINILKKGDCVVSITITTLDPDIASIIEPNAPLPNYRLLAVKKLIANGIKTTVRLDPILPFITEDGISDVIGSVASIGVDFITTSTYKARKDSLRRLTKAYPNLKERYYEMYLSYGEYRHGYYYLPYEIRKRILKSVWTTAKSHGINVGICREGIVFHKYIYGHCDGSHKLDFFQIDKG